MKARILLKLGAIAVVLVVLVVCGLSRAAEPSTRPPYLVVMERWLPD